MKSFLRKYWALVSVAGLVVLTLPWIFNTSETWTIWYYVTLGIVMVSTVLVYVFRKSIQLPGSLLTSTRDTLPNKILGIVIALVVVLFPWIINASVMFCWWWYATLLGLPLIVYLILYGLTRFKREVKIGNKSIKVHRGGVLFPKPNKWYGVLRGTSTDGRFVRFISTDENISVPKIMNDRTGLMEWTVKNRPDGYLGIRNWLNELLFAATGMKFYGVPFILDSLVVGPIYYHDEEYVIKDDAGHTMETVRLGFKITQRDNEADMHKQGQLTYAFDVRHQYQVTIDVAFRGEQSAVLIFLIDTIISRPQEFFRREESSLENLYKEIQGVVNRGIKTITFLEFSENTTANQAKMIQDMVLSLNTSASVGGSNGTDPVPIDYLTGYKINSVSFLDFKPDGITIQLVNANTRLQVQQRQVAISDQEGLAYEKKRKHEETADSGYINSTTGATVRNLRGLPIQVATAIATSQGSIHAAAGLRVLSQGGNSGLGVVVNDSDVVPPQSTTQSTSTDPGAANPT